MVICWFILFLILLVIELLTVNLVTIWFVIGSLGAMITTIFTDSLIIQIAVFIIISTITLIVTRPFVKKLRTTKIEATNSDRVIGKVGEVIKDITSNNYGEVKIFGNIWTATGKETILKGSKVKVLGIDGVKLIVEKEDE